MAGQGCQMTRYADARVIQCRTREEAESALALVGAWVTERGLVLHPTKTKIVHVDEECFAYLTPFPVPGKTWVKTRLAPAAEVGARG